MGTPPSGSGKDENASGGFPKVDRYRVIRRSGEGGMAEVYLAHDEVLGRDVALKVLRWGRVDAQLVERFRREAKSAASISHANVVSIYDWGETEDGSYYLVMEYVPGGTLKGLVDREGPLSKEKAADIAVQTAQALEAAHERGMVHRDIKPQNILLDASGGVKVTDFGIARAAAAPAMTEPGSIVGTVHYISPEQATGDPVGPASDLYSLGVVLYEMLTGQVPYDAEDPIAIAMQHVEGRPQPPKELNPDVSAGLNDTTLRLLEKNPEARGAGATALVEELRRPPDQKTTRQTEVLPEAPLRRGRKRSRLVLAAGLLAILAVVVVGVGFWLTNGPLQNVGSSFSPAEKPPSPEMAEVPDVNGEPRESAREMLDSRGFRVSVDGQESSREYEGRVVRQSPSGGELEKGEVVEIWVGQGPPPEEDAGLLRGAVKDYYNAVDREEWGYTYENLDSETREMFTEEEWFRKNQFFADNYPAELKSLRVSVDMNSSEPADVTVYRTWKSGNGNVRDTVFVYEEDSWKHRFVGEEIDLFQPDASYEQFVSYHGGGG